jgi:hemerythrin-like domain-containing protein
MVKWVDGPFSLMEVPPRSPEINEKTWDVAFDMSMAHNMFVRSLNAIYLQAEGVKNTADIRDFLLYCELWHEVLHHHHHGEETIFFPDIEKYSGVSGLMDHMVEEHHAFETGVKHFIEYVKTTTPETYDGTKLKALIDDFAPALTKHLGDEIDQLLALDKYGGEKLFASYKDLEKKVIATVDIYRAFPFALGATDTPNWPPIPWFVPWLVRIWYSWRYAGAWRFSPCTLGRVPRELPFASEAK